MLFVLKLCLTPLLIGGVALAGRRWGPLVSGLLIGLPLTTGPVSFFLAVEQGTAFATQAAVGGLLGQVSICLFCLAYSRSAPRSARDATWWLPRRDALSTSSTRETATSRR